jgi:hypothetical protein
MDAPPFHPTVKEYSTIGWSYDPIEKITIIQDVLPPRHTGGDKKTQTMKKVKVTQKTVMNGT